MNPGNSSGLVMHIPGTTKMRASQLWLLPDLINTHDSWSCRCQPGKETVEAGPVVYLGLICPGRGGSFHLFSPFLFSSFPLDSAPLGGCPTRENWVQAPAEISVALPHVSLEGFSLIFLIWMGFLFVSSCPYLFLFLFLSVFFVSRCSVFICTPFSFILVSSAHLFSVSLCLFSFFPNLSNP